MSDTETVRMTGRIKWFDPGKGFGFVANHSLVMASYISRANAAVIDLKSLLERG